MSEELGELLAPENTKQREMCEKAQAYLSSDWDQSPLPSKIEEINEHIIRVWYVYEDTWPYDEQQADFCYSKCISAYIVWGRKKRDKYLKIHRSKDASNG